MPIYFKLINELCSFYLRMHQTKILCNKNKLLWMFLQLEIKQIHFAWNNLFPAIVCVSLVIMWSKLSEQQIQNIKGLRSDLTFYLTCHTVPWWSVWSLSIWRAPSFVKKSINRYLKIKIWKLMNTIKVISFSVIR